MSTPALVVIVYDVTDDARRGRLHALLKQYGVPVQKSAFEARLTPAERSRLLERVAPLLQPTDRFVMYAVPASHEPQIAELGVPRPRVLVPRYYVV
ncbi:MAG: CRISPR-associated endonuclease Cas2 [Micrococcales bacterium]|nr:CRISPR-associated endonuclease Cas2 [Micrococcales bacterium]